MIGVEDPPGITPTIVENASINHGEY